VEQLSFGVMFQSVLLVVSIGCVGATLDFLAVLPITSSLMLEHSLSLACPHFSKIGHASQDRLAR
jgi:hypothetical protein